MKLKILFTCILIILAVFGYSQQPSCSDSSYRIKYIFGNNGATLFNNPDTSGINIFTGEYNDGVNYGIAMMKTNWGDSIYWAKKIYALDKNLANRNIFTAPGGTMVCTGIWDVPTKAELLITKLDTNGIIQWIKRFRLSQNHIYYKPGILGSYNILVANNAIYFSANFNDNYDILAKLDLNGNIVWSKHFYMNTPVISAMGQTYPVYYNNSVYFFGASGFTINSVGLITITKLNDADGSVAEAFGYQVAPDTLVKAFFPTVMKLNPDTSFTLSGNIGVSYLGNVTTANIIFNSLFDADLNPVHNFYYKNNIPLSFQDDYFAFNGQKQHAYLSGNQIIRSDKYFTTFGKNDEIIRSRKFLLPVTTSYRNCLNYDDKKNLHFIYQYGPVSHIVTEYARISNLAPNGTLGCFGKDTSILTQYPFTITKQPFTWDNIQNDVIVGNNVPYTEDTAIVTKELVCKIVSYCDSINIKGPATVCINQPVRYTVNKNNGCFKNSDWVIDTSFANIINTEGDSAINISFKKLFAGYIHAAINDCVVKDSFFVKTVPPKILKFANRDSLLCPGKSITLKADSLYSQYQWQDGSTADSLLVTGPGFYKLTATDFCGFKTADSITVAFTDSTLNIPATQAICKYDTAFITLPPDVNNITWLPFTNALLNNKTLLLYPLQNTVYHITAGRLANCPITKTTAVTVTRCPEIVFIPNAFTPDNNGTNDVFKASSYRPLTYFRLVIFNRYGQKLFETNNINAGWDGNYKGSKQPTGGYVYQCSYSFASGYQETEGGYFMLLR